MDSKKQHGTCNGCGQEKTVKNVTVRQYRPDGTIHSYPASLCRACLGFAKRKAKA